MSKPMNEDTIEGAITSAHGMLVELGEEMRNWYDSMPENLQGGSRAETVQETADTLEGLEAPTIPDFISSRTEKVVKVNHLKKKKASRPTRRDYAIDILSAVKDVLEAEIAEDSEDDTVLVEDINSLIGEIDQLISDAEGAEFPGWAG
jgi:hypothetical protein